jgi:hypothetical protein
MLVVEDRPFYVVWNMRGKKPRVRHASATLAVAEATRLARKEAGETFVVLAALASFRDEPDGGVLCGSTFPR